MNTTVIHKATKLTIKLDLYKIISIAKATSKKGKVSPRKVDIISEKSFNFFIEATDSLKATIFEKPDNKKRIPIPVLNTKVIIDSSS